VDGGSQFGSCCCLTSKPDVRYDISTWQPGQPAKTRSQRVDCTGLEFHPSKYAFACAVEIAIGKQRQVAKTFKSERLLT
jgi:hypothetical protein